MIFLIFIFNYHINDIKKIKENYNVGFYIFINQLNKIIRLLLLLF